MPRHDTKPARAARPRHRGDHHDGRDGPGAGTRESVRRRGRSIPVRIPLLSVSIRIPISLPIPRVPVLRPVQRPSPRLGCRALGVAPESLRAVRARLGPTVPPMTPNRRAALALAVVLAAPAGAAGPYPPYPPYPPSSAPPAAAYPPPRVIDPNPPPLSPMMRAIYAPFYVTGLILRYGVYYTLVAPFEVPRRGMTYGVEGGVERHPAPPPPAPPPAPQGPP